MKSSLRFAVPAIILLMSAGASSGASSGVGAGQIPSQESVRSPAPFLNQTREIPPRLEWNRESAFLSPSDPTVL